MKTETRFEKAVKNPGAVYNSPFDVLADNTLNEAQRLSILQSWEQDQRELEVAQEEGMTGGEKSFLDEILAAMDKLDILVRAVDAPTKQGGHPA